MSGSRERVAIPGPGGGHLSVHVRGEGPSLVLLHGFTGSADAWDEGALELLARQHRLLVPDLAGHGASDMPPEPARFGLDALLADLGVLQERLIPGPAVWLGYSMGGRLALAAAVRSTVPMRGLVLESASPGLADGAERARRRSSDESWARELETDGMEAFVDRWLAQPLFASQRTLPAEVRERERTRRLGQDPAVLAAVLRGIGTGSQPSFWHELAGLDLTALLVTGALDDKFEGIAEAMANRLPRARRDSVPGVGHAVHLEAPMEWARRVSAFTASLTGGG